MDAALAGGGRRAQSVRPTGQRASGRQQEEQQHGRHPRTRRDHRSAAIALRSVLSFDWYWISLDGCNHSRIKTLS